MVATILGVFLLFRVLPLFWIALLVGAWFLFHRREPPIRPQGNPVEFPQADRARHLEHEHENRERPVEMLQRGPTTTGPRAGWSGADRAIPGDGKEDIRLHVLSATRCRRREISERLPRRGVPEDPHVRKSGTARAAPPFYGGLWRPVTRDR